MHLAQVEYSEGYQTVFSTEKQEKEYRHIDDDVNLNTRLMMFYDLMLDVTFE